MKRKSLSKKIRFDVFKRDMFCCQYCGQVPPSVILEVDHINPVCEGGLNDIDNLTTACFDCNRGKGAISLNVAPESIISKAKKIKEAEEQLAAYREIIDAQLDRINFDAWEVVYKLFGEDTVDFRNDWFRDIKRFNEMLGLEETIDSAEIAACAKAVRFKSDLKRFKYFCAVCWNKLRSAANG